MDEPTLKALLETAGLPVAYHHFKTPPVPPYVVYLFSYSSNFGADDKVYRENPNYQVELYSQVKDPAVERLIENLFDENEVYWEKSETYLDNEGLYQVLYEI